MRQSKQMEEEESVGGIQTQKSSKKPLIALLIVLIAVAAVVISFSYSPQSVSSPSGTEGPPEEPEGPDEIEIIADNNYIFMREVLLNVSGTLVTCIALEENNISICNTLEEDDIISCNRNYNFILSYQGRCEELVDIENPPIDFELYCQALISGSCEGLSGKTELVCKHILENNISACIELGANPEYCESGDDINLYYALKNKDINRCKKIGYFYKEVLCESILEKNCNDTINDISKAWVYAQLARDFNNVSICDRINYDIIKTFCLNEEISVRDALDSI